MLTAYSSLRIPGDDHDDDFYPDNLGSSTFDDGTPSNAEGFYVLVTGAIPNSTVMKIDYYINGEFYPS